MYVQTMRQKSQDEAHRVTHGPDAQIWCHLYADACSRSHTYPQTDQTVRYQPEHRPAFCPVNRDMLTVSYGSTCPQREHRRELWGHSAHAQSFQQICKSCGGAQTHTEHKHMKTYRLDPPPSIHKHRVPLGNPWSVMRAHTRTHTHMHRCTQIVTPRGTFHT